MKRYIWLLVAAVLIIIFLIFIIKYMYTHLTNNQEIIKVGVFDELDIRDTELMALEELNIKGVLGKKIVPVMLSPHNLEETDKLIGEEKITVLFGCMSLECRRTIIPILDKYNILLFTPGAYSMQFSSSLIFSTSAAPNQQIIPAVSWCLKNLGPKVFIIGSKLEKSSAVDQAVIVQYIKEIVYAHSGQIAGEEYIKNTKTYIKQAIEKIIKTQPNSIINLLQGQDNFNFFAALRAHGISSEKIPSMSIYITELELDRLDFDQLIGDYATQNYFQSIDTPSNLEFIKNFKKIYGDKRHVNNHMENAYIGVLFWHIGVIQAQSFDTQKVRERVSTQALAAPEGVISIDKKTQHTWKPILVGRIFPNEQFGIVYNSVSTIQPLRNQQLKSNEQWHLLLRKWQDKFGSEP